MVQQKLVDIFCDMLTFDYLRKKQKTERFILWNSNSMLVQNLKQRLAIRGSNMTQIVQGNDNKRNLPNFYATLHFLKDRVDNLTSIEPWKLTMLE